MSKGWRITLVVLAVFALWGIGMSFVVPLSHSEDTKSLATALILVLLAAALGGGALAVRAALRRR